MNRVGVLKKGHSLRPSELAALKPEQIVSTQVLEYELLANPASKQQERAVMLSEIQVQIKNRMRAWYAVVQTGKIATEEQFMSVFNHYDFAQRTYREFAYGRVKPAKGNLEPKDDASSLSLIESIQQSEAGFLFVVEEAAPLRTINDFT
jgi:hypothetical protein